MSCRSAPIADALAKSFDKSTGKLLKKNQCQMPPSKLYVLSSMYEPQKLPLEPALTGVRAGEEDRSHCDALLKGLPEGVALLPLSLEGVISHSSSCDLRTGVCSQSLRPLSLSLSALPLSLPLSSLPLSLLSPLLLSLLLLCLQVLREVCPLEILAP